MRTIPARCVTCGYSTTYPVGWWRADVLVRGGHGVLVEAAPYDFCSAHCQAAFWADHAALIVAGREEDRCLLA